MTQLPRALYDAMLRVNFDLFVQRVLATLEPGTEFEPNWHIALLAHELEQIRAGATRRLMINLPPRSMKTILVSIAYPAWVLGHDPTRRLMCVTYSADVAREQAVLFNRIVRSDWYRRLFPQCRQAVPARINEWRTTSGGYRLATSIDGSVLGRGADVIILDDPNKGQEIYSAVARKGVCDAYDHVISTRLNHPRRSSIICVMQRLHAEDLAGHMLEQEDWRVVRVPAIAVEQEQWQLGGERTHSRDAGELIQPSRMGHAELDILRRKMGPTAFDAQYQQQPVPDDGVVVRRAWLRFCEESPEEFDVTLVSWDTASTLAEDACYSVGTVWGLANGELHLRHVIRERLEAPELRHTIERVHREWRADHTLIEDADLGRAIAQDLRRTSNCCLPALVRPRMDKVARMQARAVLFETGKVVLPADAPWRATYLEELLGFPNCKYSDQVDSTSQALDWLQQRFSDDIAPVQRVRQRPPGRRRPPGSPRR